MRTKNSLKNISMNFTNNLMLNILRFISRTIFIKVLGETYLGINGMLSNVLGILALADLGIGSAISYSLYKPLADKNEKKVKSLMSFYKKAYLVIAGIVLVAGLCILPFLNFFVSNTDTISGLHIYYLVFLTNMVIGYLFSYKRTLITADQKEYKIVPIIMTFNFLIAIFQIIVIVVLKNYLIYLLVQTLFTLVENIFINSYINKRYPYIKEKNIEKLSKDELAPIKKNVKALIYHKLGSYFVDSTDNIIISKFLGLSIVGLYSNYYLITNMFNTFINSALYSMVSVIGNVNVKEKPKKRLDIFKTMNFLCFIVFSICSLCLFNLFDLFVGKIWIGEQYLLDFGTVLLICFVFYINGFMHFNDAIKSSAGLYDKDKWVPIVQSLINIVLSIIFVNYFGLMGVFLGTLFSALFVMIIKPIIIYKYIFETKAWSYFICFIKQIIILIICALLTRLTINYISINNPFISFIIYGIITVIISVAVIWIFYRKSYEYNDLKLRIKFLLDKKKGE